MCRARRIVRVEDDAVRDSKLPVICVGHRMAGISRNVSIVLDENGTEGNGEPGGHRGQVRKCRNAYFPECPFDEFIGLADELLDASVPHRDFSYFTVHYCSEVPRR